MYEPEDSWAEFDAMVARGMMWLAIALFIGLLAALVVL